MTTPEKTPSEKFSSEVRATLNRWLEESDLEDLDLAEAAARTINDWLDEESVIFEADEDLLGDGEPS
jgi:hypothetical protein